LLERSTFRQPDFEIVPRRPTSGDRLEDHIAGRIEAFDIHPIPTAMALDEHIAARTSGK
jgi:hypothetical protein